MLLYRGDAGMVVFLGFFLIVRIHHGTIESLNFD